MNIMNEKSGIYTDYVVIKRKISNYHLKTLCQKMENIDEREYLLTDTCVVLCLLNSIIC